MKVQVGGEQYAVYFEYEPASCVLDAIEKDLRRIYEDERVVQEILNEVQLEPNTPRDVYCTIDRLIQDAQGDVVEADQIAEDRACVSKHDTYDKLVGRKLAFSRAVGQVQDRPLRAALWGAFLSSHYIRTGDGAKRRVV